MVGGRGLANRRDDANFIPVDVTEEVSVRLAAQSVSTLCEGRLNGLVYSVGMARPPVPIEAFDPLAFEMVHRTNVIGALLVLKYLFPSLRAARGRVVIVNSVSAHIGSRLSGIDYTMSKAALSGMVRQLALQWAPDGVLINSVFPGMTRTPMLAGALEKSSLAAVESRIPLGRVALPEEVARAICFLLSEGNTYITGSGIDVSGGLYLSG